MQKIIRDFGQSRMERFAAESSLLRALPQEHFEYRHPEPIVVDREGRILFQTNCYSMPAAFRGYIPTNRRQKARAHIAYLPLNLALGLGPVDPCSVGA